MSRFFDLIASWMPMFLVLILMGLVLPFRVTVYLLLPPDAKFHWHPLNSLYRFVGFKK